MPVYALLACKQGCLLARVASWVDQAKRKALGPVIPAGGSRAFFPCTVVTGGVAYITDLAAPLPACKQVSKQYCQ